MGATCASAFPTSAASDNSAGLVAWDTPSNALASNGDLGAGAAGFTTNAMLIALATSEILQLLFETDVIGTDADGSWSIPADATITGVEAVVEWNQSGTTGTITETLAKIYKAGTLGGTSQHLGATLYNSSATNYQSRYTTYGGQANLWGQTLTPADIGAGFGIGLQLTGDGVNNVTAAVDTAILKVFFNAASFTAVIRSNSGETTRMAPWFYHAHCAASEFSTYNPEDCLCVWEVLSFPAWYDPEGDAGTDPITGETVYPRRKQYGFNCAFPFDAAGTYIVRLRVYAPDMSEVSEDTDTVVVAADSRTRRYFDTAAVGANDGTSMADAWTAASSVTTYLGSNPTDQRITMKAGTIFKPAGGQTTWSNLSNVLFDTDTPGSVATIQRTTDGGNGMWVVSGGTRVVFKDLDFDGQNTANTTWGFTYDGATLNCGTINCTGQKCRSWNENTSDVNVRRRICHWMPAVTDIYRYGIFASTTFTDLVLVCPSFTAIGTNSGEGMIRIVGSPSVSKECARVNVLYPSLPGAAAPSQSQSAIRFWPTWGHLFHAKAVNHSKVSIGQDSDSITLYATHTIRVDSVINNPRSAWTSFTLAVGSLGALSDVTVINAALDHNGTESTGCASFSAAYNGGIRRIRCKHAWASPHTTSGGGSAFTVAPTESFVGACGEVYIYNSIIPLRAPGSNHTSRHIEHRHNDNGVAGAGGNVYGLENGGTTTRTNWRRNNTDYTITTWNALAEVADEIHSRLPRTAIDTDDLFSLADKADAGTVDAGTSTTVFTGDAGLSAENDYYNGWAIVVGLNASKTVQSYVGSTRTFTLTTALSGTPSNGDAITLSRDFSTERANGKIAYAAGAQLDIMGRFRDFAAANVCPGPNSNISLPAAPSISVAPGDEENVVTLGAIGALLTRIVFYSLTPGGPYIYLTETTSTSYAHTGLTNGTTYYYVVKNVAADYNESAYSAEDDGTPEDAVAGSTGIAAIITRLLFDE